MKSKVFIFSTRKVEDDKGLFAKSHKMYCEEQLFMKFKNDISNNPNFAIEEIKEWVLSNANTYINKLKTSTSEKLRNKILDKIDKHDEEYIKKRLIDDSHYLELLSCLPNEMKKSICEQEDYQYYEILNSETDRIVAVKPLRKRLGEKKGNNNKRWIEALKAAFSDDTNDDTEFYFILHDEDLVGYNGFEFRLLNNEDQYDNENIFKYLNNGKISIIVFQHTTNSIMDLLNENFDINITVGKIENVFYKQSFKIEIIKYIDKKFKGENVSQCISEIEKKRKKISLEDDENLEKLYNYYFVDKHEIPKFNDLINIQILCPTDEDEIYKINRNDDEHDDKIKCKVRILIEELLIFQSPDPRNKYRFNQDALDLKNEDKLIPIIHVSLFNFLDNSKNPEDLNIQYLVPYLHRYKNIMDSSIWNYYVPYYNDYNFSLVQAIEIICKNYDYGLYFLHKSKEYADLMCRLLRESYLNGKGHSLVVAPFLFHSEAKMGEVANKIFEKFEKKLSWRFLLVDDESYLSNKEIKEEKENNNGKDIVSKKSKCEIIKNVFGEDFNFTCGAGIEDRKKCFCRHKENAKDDAIKYNIEMVCVKSNDIALEMLQGAKKFDIVLMDYLLGYSSKKRREYSTELLQNIKKEFKYKDKITHGIYGKFWFFYISAYNRAVHEQLLEKRFLHTTEYWHIEEGACPINTPQLFRYLLLSFMKYQIHVITQPQEEIKNENGSVIKFITLIDLLNYIFEDKDKVRNRALKNFNNLLKLRLTYDKIKYDVCWKADKKMRTNYDEKSALIKSLFVDVDMDKNYDNAFWEHTIHLVYLTAYGTIRQWHEMWEEFILIKPYLQKVKSIVKEVEGKEIKIAEAVINGIEEYITKLQETQNK